MTNKTLEQVVAEAIWSVWDCPEEDDARLAVYAQAAIKAMREWELAQSKE